MNWTSGQLLSPVTTPPITREQLRAYADASGDTNPIHLDDDFAKTAGFPSVIVHGMLSMAFLSDFLCANFPNSRYRIHKVKVRFRKVTFPGDSVTCSGKIKNVSDTSAIVVSFHSSNQNGEMTCDGEAEVFPL